MAGRFQEIVGGSFAALLCPWPREKLRPRSFLWCGPGNKDRGAKETKTPAAVISGPARTKKEPISPTFLTGERRWWSPREIDAVVPLNASVGAAERVNRNLCLMGRDFLVRGKTKEAQSSCASHIQLL
jgi:hypothetical protein